MIQLFFFLKYLFNSVCPHVLSVICPCEVDLSYLGACQVTTALVSCPPLMKDTGKISTPVGLSQVSFYYLQK